MNLYLKEKGVPGSNPGPDIEGGSRPGLASFVVRFCRFLRDHGFKVYQTGVQDAFKSLLIVGINQKEDFKNTLRANLTSGDLEWHRFDPLFREFWAGACERPGGEGPDKTRGPERDALQSSGAPLPFASVDEMDTEAKWPDAFEGFNGGAGYSPLAGLERKDIGRFDSGDIRTASLALKKIAEPFRLEVGLRKKRAAGRGASLDVGRTLRAGLKTDGALLKLFYRNRRRRLKRLVVIADVSGSMERYSRIVMPFILGLKSVGSRAEVFVFSTMLTRITFYVRRLPLRRALARITDEAADWSGGTRIGYCLGQFNKEQGRRLLNRRTVVVILSDGWDLGAKEMLRREMAFLHENVYSVIWLNPMEGGGKGPPMPGGMKAALPHVDHYMSARSLESLSRVGRLLATLVAR